MSERAPCLRVHPAIGFARLGNSPEYLIGAETMAGMPIADDATRVGGLPLSPASESTPVSSNDFRDRNGALKRLAARFRVFRYPDGAGVGYPSGDGEEIKPGSVIGGRRVQDIIWTVHLANKKANSYRFYPDLGIAAYQKPNAARLEVRNRNFGDDLDNGLRLRSLVIDPGPRTIRATATGTVAFDKPTLASFWRSGPDVETLSNYPKSFPDDSFARVYTPSGSLDSLGDLVTDADGRLLVLGAFGNSCAIIEPGDDPPAISSGPGQLNQRGWFDDIADGPVGAVVVFDDGGTCVAHGGWVVTTPPTLAPQTPSVVTLWDDVFDTWVRYLDLCPALFSSRFRTSYTPCFATQLAPLFMAVPLQRWTTNLPARAISAHDAVGRIALGEAPEDTVLTGLVYLRNPNSPAQSAIGPPLMPLLMGDPGENFLSVTQTQYFLLSQWNQGLQSDGPPPALGEGERLDRVALFNCAGGGLAPGLDLTFIIRDPELYQADWRTSGAGPFRIRARTLDYAAAQAGNPFLSSGYVPLQPAPGSICSAPLEPGDLSKFMAVPWHADFNSCATHNADPDSTTLYWAWPARRPMQVHRAQDVHDGELGPQYYSVRGEGTYTDDLGTAGRYQIVDEMLTNWHRIGLVLQGSVIDGAISYSSSQYLEVQSQLGELEAIKPWPMNSKHGGE